RTSRTTTCSCRPRSCRRCCSLSTGTQRRRRGRRRSLRRSERDVFDQPVARRHFPGAIADGRVHEARSVLRGATSPTTGALFAWELERGRRSWRVPVRGGVITNDTNLRIAFALKGLGLAYVAEPAVAEHVRTRRLRIVLEDYAPEVPGFFLHFPSRARSSPALRAFVDTAKELVRGAMH